jgi:serine/threonine protein kinase
LRGAVLAAGSQEQEQRQEGDKEAAASRVGPHEGSAAAAAVKDGSLQQGTAGGDIAAAKGGSSSAAGEVPLPAAAAASAKQPPGPWAIAEGSLLELSCLDKFQVVTGEEFSLRVAGYVGKGGNSTVWEVVKVRHSPAPCSSSSSRQKTALPDHMALKLSLRYCDLKREQQAEMTEEELAQASAYGMTMEYAIHADCASCYFITKCFGWGVVTLPGGGQLHGMLLELATLGSVDKLLVRNGIPCGLDEDMVQRLLMGATAGLKELHTQGRAMHRDLKPSNLLMFGSSLESPGVKLSDLGSGKRLHSLGSVGRSLHVGTIIHRPPELILGYSHDGRMDTWLLGLLLLELRTGKFPFWYLDLVCRSEEEVQARRCPEELENPESPYHGLLSEEEKAFVKQCLVVDYRLRPTVKELSCTSPYLGAVYAGR